MQIRHYLLFSLMLLLAMSSCEPNVPANSGDSANTDTTKVTPEEPTSALPTIKKMSVTDASALFIASSRNKYYSPNKLYDEDTGEGQAMLYEITEEGIIKAVQYIDEEGNEVTEMYKPTFVVPVPGTHYFFCDFFAPDLLWDYFNNRERYLVNSETGAVYDAKSVPLSSRKIDYAFDSLGYIYCRSEIGENIVRINISDENNVISEIITPREELVYSLALDNDGNCFYDYGASVSKTAGYGGFHIRTRNNKIFPFAFYDKYGERSSGVAFKGLDGKLHLRDTYCVQVVNISNDTLVLDTILKNKRDDTSALTFSDFIRTNNKVIGCHKWNPILVVLDSSNPAEIGQTYQIPGISEYLQLANTENDIYCLCNNKLLIRININSFDTETIFNDEEYSICSFMVQANDVILFCAQRVADGAIVLASMETNGTINIIDDTLESPTALELL